MFKALKSFTGKVAMTKGQVKDIEDKDIAKDLLNSGYIEEVKNEIKKEVEKVADKNEEKVKEKKKNK